MKKFNLKEKFLKIALTTVTVGIVMGSVFSALAFAGAAAEPTGIVDTSDGRVLLADDLLEGGINDPVAVNVNALFRIILPLFPVKTVKDLFHTAHFI